MKSLFIGQSYIDITFLTDEFPTGDEKTVAEKCHSSRRPILLLLQ